VLGASKETEFCKMLIGLQWKHITTMFFVIESWEYTVYFFCMQEFQRLRQQGAALEGALQRLEWTFQYALP
jgi:hypothetical protein